MRFDNVGMFWQDYEQPKAHATQRVRLVPPPETGWTPPKDFPNLSGEKVIGFDTETKDLELLERGPGFVRNAAHIVGVSVATTERAWYFPLRHEYQAERSMNMDPERVFAWLRGVFETRVPIVGANLLYDLEATRAAGLPQPKGPLFDVQFAEPLLDENARSYALDVLASKYLGHGKDTSLLYQWCADSFGGPADDSQRKNIWRAPPSLVGPYAETDALAPLQILQMQRRKLHEEGLTDLFKIECGLIPLLLDMRFRGVRVDLKRAEETLSWLREEAARHQKELGAIDVWASESLARAFDEAGIEYPRTDAGNPSFRKEFLEALDHPLAQRIMAVRRCEKAANPFIESYILAGHHEGRVHCQFNPLRSDNYGTVTGRFSSSNPNLQNIPSRDKKLGPLLRGMFIPEDGCVWRRADQSQIEYRLLAHDLVGPGAEEIRERYRKDPTTDYHAVTVDMVHNVAHVTLDRTPAKNLNFGLVYGMGKDKLIRSLGVSADLGARLYEAYFEAMPSVKKTYKSAERLAKRRGYIKTLLGRRRRFTEDEGAHKALNARLQGGAADVMKKGMHDCYHAGVFEYTGTPHLTVHDELDWSDDQSPRAAEAFKEAEHILTTCVPLKVPLMLGVSTGANWGECK